MGVKEVLKNVGLFVDLHEKHLDRVVKLCKSKKYTAGETILRQGDPGEGLFIIRSGKVKIMKTTEEGREIEIATQGAGSFFGEFAVLDGARRTATVSTLEETECLIILSWDFKSMLEAHPEIAYDILPFVIKRFRETNEELLKLKGLA